MESFVVFKDFILASNLPVIKSQQQTMRLCNKATLTELICSKSSEKQNHINYSLLFVAIANCHYAKVITVFNCKHIA